MKRFKTKKKNYAQINYILILIFVTTSVILHYYNSNISPKIENIAIAKLDEITTLYVKKDIMPLVNLDNLINITLNDAGEILYVDINYDYAHEIMIESVSKIQNNILKLEQGNLEILANKKELQTHDGNLFLKVPLGLTFKGVLFSNLGPSIPIKLSFYEHALGNVETNISEYGINNALLTVTMSIIIEQKLIIPYQEKKQTSTFTISLGSKVITGVVPDFYGQNIRRSSSIIDVE